MILKSFEFQCDFDFQITTSKMIWILILNHLYLGDLILILKSSTYDDFAHLSYQVTPVTSTVEAQRRNKIILKETIGKIFLLRIENIYRFHN